MSFIKNIFRRVQQSKNLSSVLIISVLIPCLFLALPAKQADAQWLTFDAPNDVVNTISSIEGAFTSVATPISAANSVADNIKKFLLDGLATAFARLVVQGITAQTVNWINSGFNGNPAYVTNPDQFFTNVGDQAVVSTLIGTRIQTGTDANGKPTYTNAGGILNRLCSPFAPALRLALVQQYMRQNQLGQCSIQRVIKNYDSFTQNFMNGGWEGWFSMTQTMQNNPYGAYLQGQDQLTNAIAQKVNTQQNQINQGRGFLSFKKGPGCSSGGSSSGGTAWDPYASLGGSGQTSNSALLQCINQAGSSQEAIDACNQTYTSTGSDSGGLNTDSSSSSGGGDCSIVTPGSVISDQLGNILHAPVDQLNLTNSINQIVSALMVQGIKGIFGGISGGLRGLSQGGNNSVANQLSPTSPQSVAEQGSTYNSITGNVPGNLQYAAGLTTTPPAPLTPTVDTTAIQAQVDLQTDQFKKSNPTNICGNGICDGNETHATCPNDCVANGTNGSL